MPICSLCKESFVLHPNHIGKATICPKHPQEDVPRVMGKVAWSGKHTMELEITDDPAEAARFNGAQKRIGAGPLKSIITPKESFAGRESGKTGSGADAGAGYTTGLGEKRTVKR